MRRWTVNDARDLYGVRRWGPGLFDINEEGNAIVTTERGNIDLKRIVDDCQRRGIRLPLLIRLPDVLKARIDAIAGTFQTVMAESGYTGSYRGVYPIKVNQERHVVEDIIKYSRPWNMGLECGSKPELLIALARQDNPEALIIINGYKDEELIKMAVAARQLGRQTVIVIEQPWELPMVLRAAETLGVDARIGVRVKLTSAGHGRWSESSGDRAKFGLSMRQLVELVRALEEVGKLDMLELLHFHIGSQVSAIRAISDAIHEGARIYCELKRRGVGLRYFDVGGGLGVDYDGSQTDFDASMNYDLREYVSVVVNTARQIFDDADVAHPNIITESGRHLVAHSTVLVTSVLGSAAPDPADSTQRGDAVDEYASVERLWSVFDSITAKQPQRAYHEAMQVREETFLRFNAGTAGLEERAAVEGVFTAICRKLVMNRKNGDPLHEELAHLPRGLADMYFCNFSVFQSVPDAWAVSQLFPIMPIARLDERPDRQAILADLTCDSDGKIDKFIDLRDVRDTLDVHTLDQRPYYLGIFLLGAYQETLGDLHNLFGDTNLVHVVASDNPVGYRIEAFLEGDLVEDVLGFMEYSKESLLEPLRRSLEHAYSEGRMTFEVGNQLLQTYQQRLRSYTYLE